MTAEQTPEGEPGARVKSFYQIIQYNVDYNTNFVFGIGTRNDLLVKRNGVWLFKHLQVNGWTSRDQVGSSPGRPASGRVAGAGGLRRPPLTRGSP